MQFQGEGADVCDQFSERRIGRSEMCQGGGGVVTVFWFLCFHVIARPVQPAVAIQPFRRAQGPESVEGLDCFVVSLLAMTS